MDGIIMPEAKPGTVEATPRPDPLIAPFELPLTYIKGGDNLGELDGIAGTIREARANYHVARIWSDGVSNPDELAELMVKATNSYDATQTQLGELREALRELVNSAIEFDDPRISYVSMQVDRGALAFARALLSQEEG
jgi:hypothetical protein